jgi:hypothetical protein
MSDAPASHSFPGLALLAGACAAVVSVAVVSQNSTANFEPYFGSLSPPLATMLVGGAGIAALFVLQRRFEFRVGSTDRVLPRFGIATICALPFMISVTLADVTVGFPQALNVPLPFALVFYPAMGFVAQIALHIVPFALLLLVTTSLLRSWPIRRRVWLCIPLTAAVEAWFQIGASMANGGPTLLDAFVAAQLFGFGVVELALYRRFDFATMFVFRMAYYAYWHIAWGSLRLEWLF